MKLWFLALLLPLHLNAASRLQLNAGEPGCFQSARNQALSKSEIKLLSPECQTFRMNYFLFLEALQKRRAETVGSIEKTLNSARGPKPPYDAILFSVLTEDQGILLQALKNRAQFERDAKLPYAYAAAAVYRMKNGSCVGDARFQHEFYSEICLSRDSLISKIMKQRGKS